MLTNRKQPLMVALLLMMATLQTFSQSDRIRINHPQFYAIYNPSMKCPDHVGWTIHAGDLGTAKRVVWWKFLSDLPDTLVYVRHSDFTNSGYQRGHMCPAADRSRSTALMWGTFLLSNIAPQVPSLNTGAWKASEEFCRKMALRHDSVSVLVVPVFINRDTTYIGRNRLAVPHGFFKACWVTRTDSILGSWFLFNK